MMQTANMLVGYLDSPAEGTTLRAGELVDVSGWAYAYADSIVRLDVLLGDRILGALSADTPRPDVAQVLGVRGMPDPGFHGMFTIPCDVSGPQFLTVAVTDTSGRRRELGRLVHVVAADEPAPGPGPHLQVESPLPWAPVSGALTVSGWAFHPQQRIVQIRATLGGREAGDMLYGLPRADVEAHYATVAARYPGFCGKLRIPPDLSPEAVLLVQACDDAGGVLESRIPVSVLPVPDVPSVPDAAEVPDEAKARRVDEAVARVLAAVAGAGPSVRINTAIHPDDQMVTYVTSHLKKPLAVARSEYFKGGLNQLHVVRELAHWRFGGLDRVGAFLDFAGGFGRLTRLLAVELAPQRIWVSEIQPDAVMFQMEQFGVHGILSTSDPDEFVCDQRFDLIFVASLFSHLPEATFTPWLARIVELLNPGGVLGFSVHGDHLLPRIDATAHMPESGHWFRAGSEIETLSTAEYGTAFVTEAFVQRALHQAAPRSSYRRIHRGLAYYQDLYVVCNDAHADCSTLEFDYGPWGAVQVARWDAPGALFLGGWAGDLTDGHRADAVRILLDGQQVHTCAPVLARHDIAQAFQDDRFADSGWRCTIATDPEVAHDLTVTVTSDSGSIGLLYTGPLDALLSR